MAAKQTQLPTWATSKNGSGIASDWWRLNWHCHSRFTENCPGGRGWKTNGHLNGHRLLSKKNRHWHRHRHLETAIKNDKKSQAEGDETLISTISSSGDSQIDNSTGVEEARIVTGDKPTKKTLAIRGTAQTNTFTHPSRQLTSLVLTGIAVLLEPGGKKCLRGLKTNFELIFRC